MHHGNGPIGLLVPGWYLAPQRREVAEASWGLASMFAAALGAGGPGGGAGGEQASQLAVQVVQLAGEFADASTKARIWDAADAALGPVWDRDAGELTFDMGLDEEHPRGQLNARAMAGWVCTTGAWSRVFNEPNLAKFDQPTVVDVDFPRVAMSVARWDGAALHLAAAPQNAAVRGSHTTVRVVQLDPAASWTVHRPDGSTAAVGADGVVELVVDGGQHLVAPTEAPPRPQP